MNIWAVILAAGLSSRLTAQGVSTPKQFLSLDKDPLFLHSAHTLARNASVRGIIFVFPPSSPTLSSHEELCTHYATWLRKLDARIGLPWKVTLGGVRRQDSVRLGLAALPADCDAVLVHDAARPFVTPALTTRIVESLRQGHSAVIPGIALTDTVKTVDATCMVSHTPPRETLRAIQTPQGFLLAPLRQAHEQAETCRWEVTDDAELMERCGTCVLVVQGEEGNRKITTLADIKLLSPANKEGSAMNISCSGLGYDVHRYGGNRPFILGGVPIATNIAVAAHSDGDTLLHALMDAMLGCIGAGDIGGMFPDSDPMYENISSGILLAEVRERLEQAGCLLTHVDITIIAQVPRIAPHRAAIAKNVAKLLHLPVASVNIKATTEEHLGFTGEKRGIKVMALVSAIKPPQHS